MVASAQEERVQNIRSTAGWYCTYPSTVGSMEMALPQFQPRRLWTPKVAVHSSRKPRIEQAVATVENRERVFTMKGGFVDGKGLVIAGKIFIST